MDRGKRQRTLANFQRATFSVDIMKFAEMADHSRQAGLVIQRRRERLRRGQVLDGSGDPRLAHRPAGPADKRLLQAAAVIEA